MFDRLILTQPESTQLRNRNGYFLVSGIVLAAGLSVALVASLFAADLDLGTDSFELTELIAPVEMPPSEPKLPEPAPAPKQQLQTTPTSAPKLPTRQAVVARVDESPRETPTAVSTVQNTQRERPSTGQFQIGKLDSDPATVASSGSGRGTGEVSGGTSTGLAPSTETVAKVVDEEPPPPIKKDPPPTPKAPVIRSMGVINGKAASLPLPMYSAAAKAVNARGAVNVRVLIDEKGNVISADAVSGHPLLKASAESAARKARFTPTVLSGEPIKISGTIVYNFTG